MKRTLSIALILVLLLIVTGCGQKTEPKYILQDFQQEIPDNDWIYTERYIFDRQYRIDEAIIYINHEEQNRKYYEYTDTGVIITTGQGKTAETLEVVNQLDETGNVVKSEQYLNGEFYSSTESAFDEKGNLLTRISNSNGYLVTEHFDYDENGKEISYICDYGDGRSEETVKSYDDAGYPVSSVTADQDGNIILREEITYNIADDGFRSEFIYTYDAYGNLVGSQNRNYMASGEITSIFFYDAAGKIMSSTGYGYVLVDMPIE